jgi:hypothetical protein
MIKSALFAIISSLMVLFVMSDPYCPTITSPRLCRYSEGCVFNYDTLTCNFASHRPTSNVSCPTIKSVIACMYTTGCIFNVDIDSCAYSNSSQSTLPNTTIELNVYNCSYKKLPSHVPKRPRI